MTIPQLSLPAIADGEYVVLAKATAPPPGVLASASSGAPNSPDEPSSWSPSLNDPVVSLFQGSATYNYPIEAPPTYDNLTGWKVSLLTTITEKDKNGNSLTNSPNVEFDYQFRRTGSINFSGVGEYRYCYPYIEDIYTFNGPPNGDPTVSFTYYPEGWWKYDLQENNFINAVSSKRVRSGWDSDAPVMKTVYHPINSPFYDVDEDDTFAGFQEMKVDTRDSNDGTVRQEEIHFLTYPSNSANGALTGKIGWQLTSDGNGTELARTDNTWGMLDDYTAGNLAKQPILTKVVTTDLVFNTANRVEYLYDGYGNQTEAREFGNDLTGSTPVRTAETRYLHNASVDGSLNITYDAFAGGSFDTDPANWILTDHAATDVIGSEPVLRMWGEHNQYNGWSHRPLKRTTSTITPGYSIS